MNRPIESIFGMTKKLSDKLHDSGICTVSDLLCSNARVPRSVLVSAELSEIEVRVTRERGELELNELGRILSGLSGELILAGSYRRGSELMKDLDFIFVSDTVTGADIVLALPEEYHPVLLGDKKIMVYSVRGEPLEAIRIDLNVVPRVSRATALVHYTGSKESNIRLRVAAKARGLLLNDKYIMNLSTGKVFYPETEEQVFETVGLKYLEPEQRV